MPRNPLSAVPVQGHIQTELPQIVALGARSAVVNRVVDVATNLAGVALQRAATNGTDAAINAIEQRFLSPNVDQVLESTDPIPRIDFQTATTNEIVSSVDFVPNVNGSMTPARIVNQMSAQESFDAAMQELQNRIDNGNSTLGEIQEQFNRRIEAGEAEQARAVGLADLGAVEAANDVLGGALRNLPNLPDAIGRLLRGRRNSDRFRVSTEYHEYQYVRQNMLRPVFLFIARWDEGSFPENELAEAAGEGVGNGFAQSAWDESGTLIGVDAAQQVSYGEFVDLACLRRFIGRWRVLHSKVYAANVACALRLANGISQDDLFESILAGWDWTPVIEELIRTLRNDVGYGTNRARCMDIPLPGVDDLRPGSEDNLPTGPSV